MNTIDESAGMMVASLGAAARNGAAPSAFKLGRVVSASPLRITCDGQTLATGDLFVNEALLSGYCPQLTGTLRGSCPDGGVTVTVEGGELTRGRPALAAGDRVVLFSADGQIYYLLAKVVRV